MSVPAPHVRQRRRYRTQRLRALGFDSYDAYLASPYWAQVRARYRASNLPQDCMCGATEGLHLHHKTYERIGCERLEDLMPLCPSCHQMVHELDARGDMGINLADFADEKRAERYARRDGKRIDLAHAEYRDEHLHRYARRLGNRIKQAAMSGQLTGADIVEIERILDRASGSTRAA